MFRYVQQPNNYSCGPVAIYNALIAIGKPPRSIRQIYKDCDPHPDYGTLFTNMHNTILKHLPNDVECEYIQQPEYTKIKSHMEDGGVVIICEHWETTPIVTGEHYYTIIGMQGENFLVTNSDDCRKKNSVGIRLIL